MARTVEVQSRHVPHSYFVIAVTSFLWKLGLMPLLCIFSLVTGWCIFKLCTIHEGGILGIQWMCVRKQTIPNGLVRKRSQWRGRRISVIIVCLDAPFPHHWIDRSPDPNRMHISIWGHLRSTMYVFSIQEYECRRVQDAYYDGVTTFIREDVGLVGVSC